jgi:hypothetical protein
MLITFSQLRKRGKGISQRYVGGDEPVQRLAGIEAERCEWLANGGTKDCETLTS